MPTAVIAGATGLLGHAILDALVEDPEWTSIHALCCTKRPRTSSDKITYNTIDLTASRDSIAEWLQEGDVHGEYLFFSAYLSKNDEEEATKVNGAMLQNLLHALKVTGAARVLKRVILTAGAKQYGVHLGPVKNPMQESDPWVESSGRPPNFYYAQQRILDNESTASDPPWDWVVTYPNDVIGVADGNFMNLSTSLAIYATICAEMGTGGEKLLDFPGSEAFYTRFDSFTSARLHAQFSLWAARTAKCGNQAFNVVNGDVESWVNMWPKLARRFGCKVPPQMFQRHLSDGEGFVLYQPSIPPLEDSAVERGLVGKISKGKVEMRINLMEWSKSPGVQEAWQRIVLREDIRPDGLQKATWMFLGIILGRQSDFVLSMSKARKFGWTGYKDTWEALEETFGELEQLKIIPRVRV